MRGMTLIELMIVVAIVGVMAFAAMFALSSSTNAQSSANLARSIQFTAQRAHGEAVGDQKQRALTCDPTPATGGVCTYKIAKVTGSTAVDWTDSSKYDADGTIPYGKKALVWNVTATTDFNADNSGSKVAAAKTIAFYPNGSADKGTFYVADTNAKTSNKFKIYIYQGTGMARLVSNW